MVLRGGKKTGLTEAGSWTMQREKTGAGGQPDDAKGKTR